MASKTTYIYRVEIGHNEKIEHTEYCYARNAKTAKEYYKEKYKENKYNIYNCVAFGDADSIKHPGPIEELPEDEVKYIRNNNLGTANAYSNRKDNRIIEGGEFIPVSEATL